MLARQAPGYACYDDNHAIRLRNSCVLDVCRGGARRRRAIRAISAIDLARGAGARRLAQRPSTRRHAASSPISRCPISPFPAASGAAAAAAGIRADAGAISARADLRSARRAGQETRRAIPRHAGAHREGIRRARQCRAGDLGARDRLRRRKAAVRRAARAGDAGLCRQAQGFLPQRIPARAEDAAGRRAARRFALVLGRRDGAHPVPAVGILQIRRRFRRRRPRRHLAFGAGRAGLGGQAARRTKAGRRASPGRSRCARRRWSIAPSRSRASPCRSPNGSSAATRRPTAAR